MKYDRNLYFSTSGPVTINAFQPVTSPLGTIVYAGTKWNSQATYAHAAPPDYLRPTPHYLLVYTLEGEADYFDDTGIKTVMGVGSLMWAAPGVNQSYGPRSAEPWSEFFMWFGGPLFDLWQASGYPGPQSRHLQLEPRDYWLSQFQELVAPVGASSAGAHLLRLGRLQQILATALQLQEQRCQSTESCVWRETAIKHLTSGTLNSPALEEVAGRLNVSYSLFRKKFLNLTGRTPGQYRAEWIMQQAGRRLVETSDSVGQIAEELGFYDQFHFSRRFKQVMGLAPADFRRQTVRPPAEGK